MCSDSPTANQVFILPPPGSLQKCLTSQAALSAHSFPNQGHNQGLFTLGSHFKHTVSRRVAACLISFCPGSFYKAKRPRAHRGPILAQFKKKCHRSLMLRPASARHACFWHAPSCAPVQDTLQGPQPFTLPASSPPILCSDHA